jgi:hypothetical protein
MEDRKGRDHYRRLSFIIGDGVGSGFLLCFTVRCTSVEYGISSELDMNSAMTIVLWYIN